MKICHFSLQYNHWKMKIYVHKKEVLRKCDQLNFDSFVKLLNFVNVFENRFFRLIDGKLFISKVINCIFGMTRMYFFSVKKIMSHFHLIAKKIREFNLRQNFRADFTKFLLKSRFNLEIVHYKLSYKFTVWKIEKFTAIQIFSVKSTYSKVL